MFIAWFLYRHGRVRPIPATLGFAESIATYRVDLERRRRLSKSFFWWYVLPLGIGMGLMVIGPQLQRPDSLPDAGVSALVLAVAAAILVILQKGAAEKSLRRIDQLSLVSEKTQADCE